jgi:hypothetical protein
MKSILQMLQQPKTGKNETELFLVFLGLPVERDHQLIRPLVR